MCDNVYKCPPGGQICNRDRVVEKVLEREARLELVARGRFGRKYRKELVAMFNTERRSLCKYSVCSCGNKCNREVENMETLFRHHTVV